MNAASTRWRARSPGRHRRRAVAVCVAALHVAGCATTYTTPAGGVSIPALADADITTALARTPQAQWPARLVVARVQASGYWSASNDSHGRGSYSVVTTRDIERAGDLERLRRLPGVVDVGALNRLVVPAALNSIKDLRVAAAQLRADVLLLYSIDTSFRVDTRDIGPLQLISLGFLPNRKARVTATCSAAFVDVRSGFVYGLAEASAYETQRATLWSTAAVVDGARLAAESRAFEQTLAEIERTWPLIIAEQRAPQALPGRRTIYLTREPDS